MSEINAGIEIILERMKTHPDEFALGSTFHYDSKWGSFLREIMDAEYFDETEKDAVRIAIRETNREGFTGRVMQHLAGEDELTGAQRKLFLNQAIGMDMGGQPRIHSSPANNDLANTGRHIYAHAGALRALKGMIFK